MILLIVFLIARNFSGSIEYKTWGFVDLKHLPEFSWFQYFLLIAMNQWVWWIQVPILIWKLMSISSSNLMHVIWCMSNLILTSKLIQTSWSKQVDPSKLIQTSWSKQVDPNNLIFDQNNLMQEIWCKYSRSKLDDFYRNLHDSKKYLIFFKICSNVRVISTNYNF